MGGVTDVTLVLVGVVGRLGANSRGLLVVRTCVWFWCVTSVTGERLVKSVGG